MTYNMFGGTLNPTLLLLYPHNRTAGIHASPIQLKVLAASSRHESYASLIGFNPYWLKPPQSVGAPSQWTSVSMQNLILLIHGSSDKNYLFS